MLQDVYSAPLSKYASVCSTLSWGIWYWWHQYLLPQHNFIVIDRFSAEDHRNSCIGSLSRIASLLGDVIVLKFLILSLIDRIFLCCTALYHKCLQWSDRYSRNNEAVMQAAGIKNLLTISRSSDDLSPQGTTLTVDTACWYATQTNLSTLCRPERCRI